MFAKSAKEKVVLAISEIQDLSLWWPHVTITEEEYVCNIMEDMCVTAEVCE